MSLLVPWYILAWQWILAHKKILIYALMALTLAVLVLLALKGCSRKKASIDLESVTKINSADRKERLEELQKTIEQNQDVIQNAANNSTLAEQDAITRSREIQAKVDIADKAIETAKQSGHDVTQEQLVCLLQPENCK